MTITPFIKTTTFILTSLTVIVSTAFAVDGTYARTEDVEAQVNTFNDKVNTVHERIDTNAVKVQDDMEALAESVNEKIDDSQKIRLEDQIFELKIKPAVTEQEKTVNKALIERYQQRLQSLK